MKLQKQSPERALRTQGGVKPLHKSRSYTTSPKGAAEGSVTPTGFMCNAHGRRGFTPACGLFRPSTLRAGNRVSNLLYHKVWLRVVIILRMNKVHQIGHPISKVS